MKSTRRRHGFRMPLRVIAAVAWLMVALGAAAQSGVVKCIDPAGNTTYQDAPCEPGQAGRSVELPKAEDRALTEPWEAAAREGRVIRGMPKRWVLRARGAPLEIRPGSIRDEATEIWRYAARGGVYLIGFSGPDVAWTREETAPIQPADPGKGTTDAGKAKADPAKEAVNPGTRGPQNRRFVISGRYCEHVFAEIGAADRQEPVPGLPGAVRYFYEPRVGDPLMRTAFMCVEGRVAEVERTVVR